MRVVQEFRTAIEEEAIRTGLPALGLSTAIGAGRQVIENGYEFPEISAYVSYVS